MQIWTEQETLQILKSLEEELAKAQRENLCAQADVQKQGNRIRFCLSAIHHLKNRYKESGDL